VNLGDLRASLRTMLDDDTEPFLWPDLELTRYLNNAVREASLRARLLRGDATSDPDLCVIAVDPATNGRIQHDPAILVVRSGTLDNGTHKLWAMSSYDMDRVEPGWDAGRQETSTPRFMVMDLQQKTIQLWPRPADAVTLHLRVWRLPLDTELMVEDDDEPVIQLPDPEELRHWAAHEAYLKRDADANAEDASGTHLSLFEQRFGLRPSNHEMARWADSPPRVRRAHIF